MKLHQENVEIISGNNIDFNSCIEIAVGLPEYFDEKGIKNLKEDIKVHQLFVAVDSGKIRGFIIINTKYKHAAEILWLAVSPEHWRKGYGTALIEHVVRETKKQNVKILEVKTLAPQAGYPPYEQTRNFYEKLGFMLTEIIDPYPGWRPGNPCAIYVKIL